MMVAMFIGDVLADLGCVVVGMASRAEEAIALVEAREIDAAVLDINLGHGHTSYPVAEVLARRGVPFAFVTGYGVQGLREDYRDRPILAKPFRNRDLERVMATLLGGG